MSAEEYYSDESQWGNYQKVPLEQVINNYIASRDPDDYDGMAEPFRVRFQARRGLREFYYDILREVKALEIDLPPSRTVVLPPDYVNLVRLSWVGEDGKLHPMAQDETTSIAVEYLQDHQYNILFDAQGCVLVGDYIDTATDPTDSTSENVSYDIYAETFRPNRDMGRVFPNGKFRIDKQRGFIYFGSESFGNKIVLEYISDGMFTGSCGGVDDSEISVHKFAESALMDYIYYELIKKRRNVPANEKARARKEFYNSRRITKRRLSSIKLSDILKVLQSGNVAVKPN